MFDWVTSILKIGSTVAEKVVPDVDLRKKLTAEYEMAVLQLAKEMDESQTKVNMKEAESPSMFVAGWRPFIGWICGASVAYQFLLRALLDWACGIVSAMGHYAIPAPPSIDTDTLVGLLTAMLGIGGLRTLEKWKGVETTAVAKK